MATTNKAGTLRSTHITGPFGENLPNQTNPNNTTPGTTNNYVGRAQKLTETTFSLQLTQMGARVYVPSIGRFLQVDPVEGGTRNNYVYATNPVSEYDLNGMWIGGLLMVISPLVLRAVVTQASKQVVKQTVKTAAPQVIARASTQATGSAIKVGVARTSSNVRVVNGPGIYRFDNTPSGKPYIGKSVNVNTRIQQHPNTGKYLGGPVDVMRMPNAANVQLRIQEQSAINQAGGLGQLENKINSIAPKYWDDLNIQGPM